VRKGFYFFYQRGSCNNWQAFFNHSGIANQKVIFMKTMLTIVCCLMFAAFVNAQNTGKETNQSKGMADKYVPGYSRTACVCVAKEQGGQVVIERAGKTVSGEVVVAHDVKVTSDGKLKKQNGAERMLTDGNCISDKGTITMVVK
jgi:hypothetical protein